MKLVLYVAGGFVAFLLVLTLIALVQDPSSSPVILFVFWVLFGIPTFGAFWMMYVSIRFERNPFPLILLSFIPFTFLWYYFERVRPQRVRTSPNLQLAYEGTAFYKEFCTIKIALLTTVAVLVYAIAFWIMVTPGDPSRIPLFIPLSIAVFAIPPIGGWWLIYMVIRREKRVFPLILLAFVPYGFVWYYFERVRSGN